MTPEKANWVNSSSMSNFFCCDKTILPVLSNNSSLSVPFFTLLPVNSRKSTVALNIPFLYVLSKLDFKKKSQIVSLG